MHLKGKVAIVIGGGFGIGRATAQLFAKVAVADFNADLGRETLQAMAARLLRFERKED